jgi:4-amino-4-deoxy-L-arabinose transferase-like glycosyltransferase
VSTSSSGGAAVAAAVPPLAVSSRLFTAAARFWRGRPDDPGWLRPVLLALLAATSVLYLWGLGASGWANAYYSGAVQAGSQSWKALFFGSFDAANAITVDKPPASLWVMALVVPAFALAYLVAAPGSLVRRITQLLCGGLAMVVSAGWCIAIVEFVPARYGPYVGGSEKNSVWELIWGYNGLGRIFGNTGPGPGGGPGSGFPGGNRPPGGFGGGGPGGQTGVLRMFETASGGQIAWLLPAALVLLVAALVMLRRAPRTDLTRAGLILWGVWLLGTALVFSFMAGIYHDYYTVALAPAVAAVVAIGAATLWRRRDHVAVLAVLAATTAATAVWAWRLLGRSPDWPPWLRWVVLAVAPRNLHAFSP